MGAVTRAKKKKKKKKENRYSRFHQEVCICQPISTRPYIKEHRHS